jgi:hypothetical protein
MNTKTILGLGAVAGAIYLANNKTARTKTKKAIGLSNRGRKLTQAQFIKSTNNPTLTRAILKQGDVDWADLIKYPEDYSDAGSGSVSGMIYYADTVKFGKKYQNAILDELEEFEEETGGKLKKPKRSDSTQYYNWLSWFAWENMMSNLRGQLDV